MIATAAVLPATQPMLAPHSKNTIDGLMPPQKTWIETIAIRKVLTITLAVRSNALCESSTRSYLLSFSFKKGLRVPCRMMSCAEYEGLGTGGEKPETTRPEDINSNLCALPFVKFVDWFPYYQGIRAEFGYSSEKDQEAARMLSDMAKKKAVDPRILERKIKGKNVIVIGAGSGLEDERATKYIKKNKGFVTIAADGAVQFLLENKIKPDIVVTDLDGDPASLQKAEKSGATMVVHAHGDNTDLLKKMVPKFKKIIATTQVMPLDNVYNFGGFTDGDRCVFLADEFGAKKIVLLGMELDSPDKYSKKRVKNPELKKQKMQAGRRLLEMLAKQSRSELADTSKRPVRGFASLSRYR